MSGVCVWLYVCQDTCIYRRGMCLVWKSTGEEGKKSCNMCVLAARCSFSYQKIVCVVYICIPILWLIENCSHCLAMLLREMRGENLRFKNYFSWLLQVYESIMCVTFLHNPFQIGKETKKDFHFICWKVLINKYVSMHTSGPALLWCTRPDTGSSQSIVPGFPVALLWKLSWPSSAFASVSTLAQSRNRNHPSYLLKKNIWFWFIHVYVFSTNRHAIL